MRQGLKVLVVEDDSFTRALISNALEQQGFTVFSAATVPDSIASINENEPHVVVSDLDLGKGPSGIDLLNVIARDYPWMGMVALSAHSAAVLAGSGKIPDGVPYLVKSNIADLDEIAQAVYSSISKAAKTARGTEHGLTEQSPIFVSKSQAETLRLLSQGLSNLAISEARGTSTRATEMMIQRTYQALGLSNVANINPRVEAVSLWKQGRVQVR